MSTKNPSKQKRKQPSGQQQRPPNQQTQQFAKPKPPSANAVSLAAQDAARKELRLQRQAQARAEAEKRKRQANLRRYGIIAAITLAMVALITWLFVRELGKPGQAVDVMVDRQHMPAGTTGSTYNTDPPTSGPHVDALPAFDVHTVPITRELQVHGLEDGAVIITYQPDLDKPTVDKLTELTRLYLGDPVHNNVILAPHDGTLSNPIVLTTWGRIDRLDVLDEARIRRFVEAYANVDHHEGKEGQYIP